MTIFTKQRKPAAEQSFKSGLALINAMMAEQFGVGEFVLTRERGDARNPTYYYWAGRNPISDALHSIYVPSLMIMFNCDRDFAIKEANEAIARVREIVKQNALRDADA